MPVWFATCSNDFHAGVIFWQWGFAPYIAEEFLQGCIHCQAIQVSSSDGVFKNIIAPAAEYAAQVAVSRSPIKGCKPGMVLGLGSGVLGLGSGVWGLGSWVLGSGVLSLGSWVVFHRCN